jgi:hypothetical protein
MGAQHEVLSNDDLLENIFDKLHFAEISGVRYVCRAFDRVGKRVAHEKKTQIDVKVNTCIYKYFWFDRQYFFYSRTYNFATCNIFLINMLNMLEFIYKLNPYFFVHDPYAMNGILIDMTYVAWWIRQTPMYLQTRFKAVLLKIRPYMYILSPENHSVHTLRVIALMKGVPKAYKMRRSQLVRALTRPKNEIYVFDS